MADNSAGEPGTGKSIRETETDAERARKMGVDGISVSTVYTDALADAEKYMERREYARELVERIEERKIKVGELIGFVRMVADDTLDLDREA